MNNKILRIGLVTIITIISLTLGFKLVNNDNHINKNIASNNNALLFNNDYSKDNINNSTIDKIKNNCSSFVLVEPTTNSLILSYNKEKRLQIASMVKIMTLLVIFDEINSGNIGYDDIVTISKNAASIEGSQILLDEGSRHKVSDLIKSVVVASANDSVIALCEKISGSEENFVDLMNKKAESLGLKNTKYVNATGLPINNQFSSAEDVSIVFKELIKNNKYLEFCKIWLEDYKHPSGRVTTMTNTNKLIKYYSGCIGGKTGYTTIAKHCLSAAAVRNNTKFIAVVIGANSSKERFFDVSELFNYGFNNYINKVIFNKGQKVTEMKFKGASNKLYNVYTKDDITIFSKNNQKINYKINLIDNKIIAPIKKGNAVAKIKIDANNTTYYYDLVTNVDIKRANYIECFNKIIQLW